MEHCVTCESIQTRCMAALQWSHNVDSLAPHRVVQPLWEADECLCNCVRHDKRVVRVRCPCLAEGLVTNTQEKTWVVCEPKKLVPSQMAPFSLCTSRSFDYSRGAATVGACRRLGYAHTLGMLHGGVGDRRRSGRKRGIATGSSHAPTRRERYECWPVSASYDVVCGSGVFRANASCRSFGFHFLINVLEPDFQINPVAYRLPRLSVTSARGTQGSDVSSTGSPTSLPVAGSNLFGPLLTLIACSFISSEFNVKITRLPSRDPSDSVIVLLVSMKSLTLLPSALCVTFHNTSIEMPHSPSVLSESSVTFSCVISYFTAPKIQNAAGP
eukprot:m.390679 g.390679  ORF g.390679 m.390679 type:complete len:327 (+) comp21062_c0_seq1:2736-3716(+)